MPLRTLVELLHLVTGLVAAAAISAVAAWSYPLGRNTIWWVGYAAMVAVVLMNVGPILRAWRRDRAQGKSGLSDG